MGIFSDIAGGIGDTVGGIIAQGDANDAQDYYRKEREGYEGLGPNIDYQDIASDPAGRAAQMDALSQLQNQYRSGGLDAIDRAKLADINNNSNQLAEQNRQAVAQGAMRQGNWNSGNALVSQQLAGQQAANMANYQGIQAGSQALQNRQRAIGGAAEIGGNVADARDMISRFNATNRLQAQQMSFNNALARQNGISRGYENQAGGAYEQADRTQRKAGSIGRTIGAGGDAAAAAFGGPPGAGAGSSTYLFNGGDPN